MDRVGNRAAEWISGPWNAYCKGSGAGRLGRVGDLGGKLFLKLHIQRVVEGLFLGNKKFVDLKLMVCIGWIIRLSDTFLWLVERSVFW